ncbi:MAG: TetR/AcrR family transcriptional regulator [Marmoricola sp.]
MSSLRVTPGIEGDTLGRIHADSLAEAPVVAAERRKRGRPRDPAADVRILEAAAALMLAHGFDNMTVDDVASRAKVGKATVYRRWARKEDLAVAAMQRLYDAQMPTPDTGSIREDLRQSFTDVLAFANSAAGAAYLRTCIAESIRDPRIAALYRAANDQAEAGAKEMFERAIERGEVRPDINVAAVVQVIAGILLVRTITAIPMPGQSEVDSLVDLVLIGSRA